MNYPSKPEHDMNDENSRVSPARVDAGGELLPDRLSSGRRPGEDLALKSDYLSTFMWRAAEKFDRGQAEHKGILTNRDCLGEAREEVIDLWHYFQGYRQNRASAAIQSPEQIRDRSLDRLYHMWRVVEMPGVMRAAKFLCVTLEQQAVRCDWIELLIILLFHAIQERKDAWLEGDLKGIQGEAAVIALSQAKHAYFTAQMTAEMDQAAAAEDALKARAERAEAALGVEQRKTKELRAALRSTFRPPPEEYDDGTIMVCPKCGRKTCRSGCLVGDALRATAPENQTAEMDQAAAAETAQTAQSEKPATHCQRDGYGWHNAAGCKNCQSPSANPPTPGHA
jgi:hypothetical protein